MLESFETMSIYISTHYSVEYLLSCSTALLFFLLIISKQTEVSAWKKIIIVSPNGSDNLCQTKPNWPCRTLDKAFAVAKNRGANSTLILVQAGRYNISTKINFRKVQDFALKGNEKVVAICINSNISLSFILSANILIENIKFSNCGDWHESTAGDPTFPHYKHALFVTALYFNYCRNLTLNKLRVIKTPGIAVNMYDVGTVNAYECEFVSNKPIFNTSSLTAENRYFATAGGGVFLQLSNGVFNPVNLSKAEHALYVNNHSYTFTSCNFIENEAPNPNFNETIDSPAVPFSRGGGLAFFIGGNGSNNRILIENSTFLQNKAQWGGGLQLEVQDHGQNNSFVVTGTIFNNNSADFAGGGVRMGNLDPTPESSVPNNFHFINCEFIENSAKWGGGMSVYGTTQTVLNDNQGNPGAINRKMAFSSCCWRGNSANVGSAFGAFLFNTNRDEIGPRTPFFLELENCTVTENKVSLIEDTLVQGQGAVYTLEVPVILKGGTLFNNNSYSAMVLDTATLHIKDTVSFTNNTGFRGGALALYGKSRLFFFSGSALKFENNYAVQLGGAIYFATTGPPLVSFKATGLNASPCFVAYQEREIDYDKWNTSIVFQGNIVNKLGQGDSIYATTLKNCRRAGETRKMNSAFDWKFVKFLAKNGTALRAQAEIRTDPISLKCNRSDWEKPPSEEFSVTAILIDEKRNHVPGQISVELRSKTVVLTKSSLFLSKNDKLSPVILIGKEGDSFNVTLTNTGQQIVRKSIDNLILSSCKDGFRQEGKRCVCANDTEQGIAYCDVKKGKVYIKKGYWAGKTNNGQFVTHYCPKGYCKCSEVCLYEQGNMCRNNRDGFLCGNCKNGYSVLIGSENCGKCSNLSLLWLILYAFVLLVLVMLIMMVNIDVFTGYLNAWLYSYQVIAVVVIEGFKFDWFMNFIIGISTLRIRVGKGWCLMDGIDEADKLVLMYLIPTYVLIVVFVLTKTVRVFPNWCFSRCIRSRFGPFGCICTILVFCYTDIVTISLELLNPAYENKSLVLYEEGGVHFFRKKHILYGVIALVYLVTVGLFFPLTLLCRPFFFKMLPCLNHLRGIYDSFQDVLKDEYRWSAAFYFLARLILLVLFVPRSGPLKRVLIEVACVLILVSFVHMKPYQQQYKWINTSDTILLTNLTLIAVLSSGTAVQNPQETAAKVLKVLIQVLAYVPLAYAILLLIYYLWKRFAPQLAPEHYHEDDTESTSDILET